MCFHVRKTPNVCVCCVHEVEPSEWHSSVQLCFWVGMGDDNFVFYGWYSNPSPPQHAAECQPHPLNANSGADLHFVLELSSCSAQAGGYRVVMSRAAIARPGIAHTTVSQFHTPISSYGPDDVGRNTMLW